MRVEDDFVLRQIEALRRLIEGLLGRKGPQASEEVAQEIDAAYRRLLPMDREMFEVLDARTVARMLGDAQRVALVGEVMCAEVDLSIARGDVERARQRCERLQALLSACDPSPEIAALHGRLAGRRGQLS